MDDSSPPRSPGANPTTNMHKLAAIFGIVSIFWIALLSIMEYKSNTGPIPSWFHVYNTLSLVGWATWLVYYTMIDSKREENPTPNKPHEAWNLLHIVPIALLNVTVYKSLSVKNKAQLWFFALMVFRYYRTVVTRFFYFRYKVAKPISGGSKFNSKDCTVIVPTVGPGEDSTRFANMATAILLNKPARLIFSANNKKAEKDIKEVMKELQVTLAKNIDNPIKISLQRDKDEPKDMDPVDLDPTEVDTRVGWTYVNHSNKRKQTCQAIGKVNQEGKNRVMTKVVILVDDTAIWHKNFLEATLPAFNDPEVGLVGTHKSVVYQRLDTRPPQPGDDEPATPSAFDTAQTQEHFPEQEILQPKKSRRPEDMGWLEYCVQWYWAGMWNTMGALYLMRHSYETEASNTADGGVFAVSGRTMLVLAEIVQDTKFKEEFLEEYVGGSVFTWLAWLTSWHVPLMGYLLAGFKSIGLTEKGVGPLLADDDNFITRWVIDHGHSIKIQSSPEATMSTSLGNVENFKFIDQCKRWSRTTFRQNPIALFFDRTIWWKWPISVWTVYFPWMYNGALFWDGAAALTFWYSNLYLDSPSGNARFCCLILFIWFAKLNKTWPWFWEHPLDFVLYFIIPAYPLFTYFHSLLKFATAITCWNNEWSGRNLKAEEDAAGNLIREEAEVAAKRVAIRARRLKNKNR